MTDSIIQNKHISRVQIPPQTLKNNSHINLKETWLNSAETKHAPVETTTKLPYNITQTMHNHTQAVMWNNLSYMCKCHQTPSP